MKGHRLREQLFVSRQNAVLVVPQGPVNASDSRWGKLDQKGGFDGLIAELRGVFRTSAFRKHLSRGGRFRRRARVGKVVIGVHSGGFKVVANILKHSGRQVNEVFLFDALYGSVDKYYKWLLDGAKRNDRRRLVSYYHRSKVAGQNRLLMSKLKRAAKRGKLRAWKGRGKFPYLDEKREGYGTRYELYYSHAIFIHTKVGHWKLTNERASLRDCLTSSHLNAVGRHNWFKTKHRRPRILEKFRLP